MTKPRIVLLLAVLLMPSLTLGFVWVFSAMQSAHTFSCNVSLINSLGIRKQAAGAILASDFTSLKRHNEKLKKMSDEEFKQYLSGEVLDVALCHPMASELVGILPGKDYLAPLDKLTRGPSTADRKVSYAIWAYSGLYRSLNKYITELQSGIISSVGAQAELAAAQRLAKRLHGLGLAEVAQGAGGVELSRWLREEVKGIDIPATAGALRPTVPVYALVNQELLMYEVETVHLLFSSSVGASQYCYERYTPDFPAFARLINTGRAKKIAKATLTTDETTEILKFFNSAADVQAQAFLLSDLTAIAMHNSGKSNASSLSSCLNLTSSTVASEEVKITNWDHGTSIHFKAEDKLWQTLIAMLAAKRILVAEQE